MKKYYGFYFLAPGVKSASFYKDGARQGLAVIAMGVLGCVKKWGYTARAGQCYNDIVKEIAYGCGGEIADEKGMKMRGKKSITIIVFALIAILATGVIGYSLLLHISFLDALYMTVITVSTVGYKEVAVMTPEAKLFSIAIIILSIGFIGYILSRLASLFFEGDLNKALYLRRIKRKMKKMQNHYILCGAGETGEYVVAQFVQAKAPYIVIESDKERVDALVSRGIMAIQADATDQNVLIEAGIEKACGLISALPTDAENVFTVLTSRYLNKNLYIISRAIESNAHEKLLRAGANRVISPAEIGGHRMAALMLHPAVIAFLDMVNHVGDDVLKIEDVVIFKGSKITNQTLKQARIPEKTGLIVMAIKKNGSQQMVFNPGSDEKLETGDSMIVLGKNEQVDTLRKLANELGGNERA